MLHPRARPVRQNLDDHGPAASGETIVRAVTRFVPFALLAPNHPIGPENWTYVHLQRRMRRSTLRACSVRMGRHSVETLSIEHDREGETPVLRVRGELDRLTADSLDLAVREVAAQAPPALVLDVRGLEFIDSAGLRSLSRAHSLLHSSGRSFVLRAPSPTILRLLELVGLREILTIDAA